MIPRLVVRCFLSLVSTVSFSQDWNRIEESVVKVKSMPCKGTGKVSEGTGVLVDYRGQLHVLTALHVLQYNQLDRGSDDNPLCHWIESPHLIKLGFPETRWSFQIQNADWAYDLALLKPDYDRSSPVRMSPDLLRSPLGDFTRWQLRKFLTSADVGGRYLDIVNIVVRNGEELVAYGYPAGSNDLIVDTEIRVTQHQVDSQRLAAAPHVIESTGSAEFGMSGGPVFTQKGELVGLLSGKKVKNNEVLVETLNVGLLLDWVSGDRFQNEVFVESSESPESFCFSEFCWTTQGDASLKLKVEAWNAGTPGPARRTNRAAWARFAQAASAWNRRYRDVEIPYFMTINLMAFQSLKPDSFVWIYRSSDQFYPAVFSGSHFEEIRSQLSELAKRCQPIADQWRALSNSIKIPRGVRYQEAEPFYTAQALLRLHTEIWFLVDHALKTEPKSLAAIQSHRLQQIWEARPNQGGLEKLKALHSDLFEKNKACVDDLRPLVSD